MALLLADKSSQPTRDPQSRPHGAVRPFQAGPCCARLGARPWLDPQHLEERAQAPGSALCVSRSCCSGSVTRALRAWSFMGGVQTETLGTERRKGQDPGADAAPPTPGFCALLPAGLG